MKGEKKAAENCQQDEKKHFHTVRRIRMIRSCLIATLYMRLRQYCDFASFRFHANFMASNGIFTDFFFDCTHHLSREKIQTPMKLDVMWPLVFVMEFRKFPSRPERKGEGE